MNTPHVQFLEHMKSHHVLYDTKIIISTFVNDKHEKSCIKATSYQQ